MNKANFNRGIKSFAPIWIRNLYKNYQLKKIYRHEMTRFVENYGSDEKSNQNQLNAKLIFHSHAIEKGLSHLDFRPGFGINALTALHDCMVEYKQLNYSKEELAYKNALSCLSSYKQKHLSMNEILPKTFSTLFFEFEDEIDNENDSIGGYTLLQKKSKEDNANKNFKDLFESRVSVREYANGSVDINLVKEAIQISTKTPSVCNRQSSRVRIITNSELIASTLKAQGGYTGYKLPPMLLLVTTDTGAFVDHTERNQVYIDGGLFAMSLLVSLEYVGLGACALNAMFSLDTERNIRTILDIPENENLIVFITIGNLLDITPCPKSFRYSFDDISLILD
ncbi:nitroreductase family protein [Enterococcus avium]|jgi:nitroreductase|uniref:nitroreductase family protein n=1 Tax=Enterococcus avium TaxID=33945 RepID=UPI00288F1111|nr:nitroreductase family protein [Enterococcus avium]MDT2472011.1 hypothetical protein [Enterococcus avium]